MNCAICGAVLYETEDDPDYRRAVEFGDIAEMYDPATDEGGIVHTTCGLGKKWEVA